MSEVQLHDVVAACPNARFHLRIFCVDFPASALSKIGRRLEAVTMFGYFNDGDYGEWTSGWNKCINLRELYFNSCAINEAEAIFSTRKKHLTVLRLGFS